MSERIEDLQCNGLKIIQDDELYTFTSDSVILANFLKIKKKDLVVEIGGGSGVISILAQAKNNVNQIKIFEIQEKMQELCKKNIILNNLSDKLELICDDVKNFRKYVDIGQVDVVFSNPPYFKCTNFKQSLVKKLAKEEVLLNIANLVKVSSQMLKFGGSFYCTFPAERSVELVTLCEKHHLAVKELLFTENGKGEVKLVVLKAVKGGKNGVKIYPNLITNSEDGGYLQQLQTKNFINKN